MTKGPHKRTKQVVCRECNAETKVPKGQLDLASCPECGIKFPPPPNPFPSHIRIIE